MAVQSIAIKQQSGKCPHGMPPGACPICNGMGGGGSTKKADFSAKAGEMSWNDCYAIGQMLKAQKLNAQADKQAQQQTIVQNTFFAKIAASMAQNMTNFRSFIANNILNSKPIIAIKTVAEAIAKPAVAIANTVKNISANITKTINQFKAKFIDISDKLAAILGEQKQALEKMVQENIDKLKKRLKSLFGMIDESTNEESQAEEIKQREKEKNRFKKIKEKLSKLVKTKEKKK